MTQLDLKGELSVTDSQQTLLPLLIYRAGDKAQYKYAEFFTNTLRNANTRKSYARACKRFFDWCADKGLSLETVHPVAAAAYFRALEEEMALESVKQHLAAVRRLYDWLVVEGAAGFNPVSSVRGPRVSYRKGKTPVLTADQTRRLLDAPDPNTLKGKRDRALLAVLFYAWVRASAAAGLEVRDYQQQGRRTFLRFREKGGKVHEVPAHHHAQDLLDIYIRSAGIDLMDKTQQRLPLFRTLDRRRNLSDNALRRQDVTKLLKRYALEARLPHAFSAHSARATGITTYLDNGGTLEVAQDIAGHADSRTTRLYDRTKDKVTLSEVERVRY